jgi:plasmid stabilization system protein ParE
MRPDVVITPEAAEEIVEQIAYYHRRGSPATAERWATRVDAAIDRLAASPGIGEPSSTARSRAGSRFCT